MYDHMRRRILVLKPAFAMHSGMSRFGSGYKSQDAGARARIEALELAPPVPLSQNGFVASSRNPLDI